MAQLDDILRQLQPRIRAVAPRTSLFADQLLRPSAPYQQTLLSQLTYATLNDHVTSACNPSRHPAAPWSRTAAATSFHSQLPTSLLISPATASSQHAQVPLQQAFTSCVSQPGALRQRPMASLDPYVTPTLLSSSLPTPAPT